MSPVQHRFANSNRKQSLSSENVAVNNKHQAYQVRRLKETCENGSDKDTMKNFAESHVLILMDDGRVPDFREEGRIIYFYVASGIDCITVCMRDSRREGPKSKRR